MASPPFFDVVAWIVILFGGALCFFGHFISKIRAALGGVLFGAFGILAASKFFPGDMRAAVLAGLISALLGALAAHVFYSVVIFLGGAALGATAGALAFSAEGWRIAGALIGGTAALFLRRFKAFLAVALTSILGSLCMTAGAAMLYLKANLWTLASRRLWGGNPEAESQFRYTLAFWCIAGIAGFLIQCKALLPEKGRKPPPPETDDAAATP